MISATCTADTRKSDPLCPPSSLRNAQEEVDHLQRDCDGLVHIVVDDGRLVGFHPSSDAAVAAAAIAAAICTTSRMTAKTGAADVGRSHVVVSVVMVVESAVKVALQ